MHQLDVATASAVATALTIFVAVGWLVDARSDAPLAKPFEIVVAQGAAEVFGGKYGIRGPEDELASFTIERATFHR